MRKILSLPKVAVGIIIYFFPKMITRGAKKRPLIEHAPIKPLHAKYIPYPAKPLATMAEVTSAHPFPKARKVTPAILSDRFSALAIFASAGVK